MIYRTVTRESVAPPRMLKFDGEAVPLTVVLFHCRRAYVQVPELTPYVFLRNNQIVLVDPRPARLSTSSINKIVDIYGLLAVRMRPRS